MTCTGATPPLPPENEHVIPGECLLEGCFWIVVLAMIAGALGTFILWCSNG